MKNKLAYIILYILLSYSCGKIETYSEIPQIQFKSAVINVEKDELDNSIYQLKLTINLIDGDGNFGLTDDEISDTSLKQQYKYNFFSKLFVIKNKEIKEATFYNIPHYNYIIPYIGGSQKQVIKADIIVNIEYSYFPFDTVFIECKVRDRNFNESNTVISEPIIIPKK
ncbi:MAG: hypothetical protein SNJ71_08695 [Bacteroidales bacterium]